MGKVAMLHMEKVLKKQLERFSCAIVITMVFLTGANAQEDKTDLSRYKVVEDGASLPTLVEFKVIEDDVRSLRKNDNCDELVIKAPDAASAANRLSNVIRQGLEPFYDANREDQGRIPAWLGEDFEALIEAETAANNLLFIRNEFWVYEAACLIELGDREDGMNKMYRALDFVDPLKQTALWKEARDTLWETVGYE
jgi:hypothetical protein